MSDENPSADLAAPDAAQCQHLAERDALGKAIAEAAVKAGIIDGKQPLTGPQLVMLCHDLAAIAVFNLTICGKRLPQAGHTCIATGGHDEHRCEYGCCVLIARTGDAVRQVQRETWDAAIAIVESCQRHSDQTMHASTKGMVGCRAAMLAQLQAAALRAEGKGD